MCRFCNEFAVEQIANEANRAGQLNRSNCWTSKQLEPDCSGRAEVYIELSPEHCTTTNCNSQDLDATMLQPIADAAII
jgi:hypothetical protein